MEGFYRGLGISASGSSTVITFIALQLEIFVGCGLELIQHANLTGSDCQCYKSIQAARVKTVFFFHFVCQPQHKYFYQTGLHCILLEAHRSCWVLIHKQQECEATESPTQSESTGGHSLSYFVHYSYALVITKMLTTVTFIWLDADIYLRQWCLPFSAQTETALNENLSKVVTITYIICQLVLPCWLTEAWTPCTWRHALQTPDVKSA